MIPTVTSSSTAALRARRPMYAAGPMAVVVGTAGLAASLLAPGFGLYATESVALVCSLVAAGMALFTAVLGAPVPASVSWPRLATGLAVAGFAASLLTVPFDVVAVAGTGLAGVGDATAREVVLRGGDYQSALARCAGLCVVAFAFGPRRPTRWWRALLIGGGVEVCASFLLMGHVRTHHPAAVVAVLALTHVVAVAAWSGGLLGLAALLRQPGRDRAQQARLLTSFAGLMTGIVVMLLAGGVGLAVVYLPSWQAMFSTSYGQVLLVKLSLVAAVLVVSASNHLRVVPAAAEGDLTALAVLRTNVAVEQVVLITVLLVTEVLMRQSPVA
jgi:copper transport protein